jgi:cellulose synthase/poly-beta-1,6-N-acetylglucosamine synthase-like glycosyltransferase
MYSVSVLLWVTMLILLVPVISDVLVAVRPRRRAGQQRGTESAGQPRLLFLVPAHDEELLVGACLGSLQRLGYPASRMSILVVADNCSDATAALVRAAGVKCLERMDPLRRGKPWAIAWAVERIPLYQYDAVVIIDADSVVDANFAQALAGSAPLAGKAVQPFNGVQNRDDSALTMMGAVFASVRAHLMNPVKQRAGLNVPLGNGLCVGTAVLRQHGWPAFSLAEDWELYAILTVRGVPIEANARARVYSQEAKSLRQSSPQRQRWAVGRMSTLFQHARAIALSRSISMHQKLDTIGELTAPGPAVQLGITVLLSAAVFIVRPPGKTLLLVGLWVSLARLALYTLIACWREPEPWRAIGAFAFLPVYAVWRLGVQVRSLVRLRSKAWIRTERHGSQFESSSLAAAEQDHVDRAAPTT